MIALDTNVVVRFLTRDDAAQAERARKLIENNAVWLTKSVLLESEWVLRYSYGFPSERILGALSGLLGLSNVMVEDAEQVSQALEWHASGMDFADALHLAGAGRSVAFSTFDQKLIKKARGLSVGLTVATP